MRKLYRFGVFFAVTGILMIVLGLSIVTTAHYATANGFSAIIAGITVLALGLVTLFSLQYYQSSPGPDR